ncbi:glycosyl hydrolase family 17 protein [Pontimicrobium sp. IMCC45349]|uniref:glycosyl hydrolase family 17 protein n=1 Tax=Pontimicrobium sp. IMCC45349 TaxID=3391574 RepID=UPI0039A191C9
MIIAALASCNSTGKKQKKVKSMIASEILGNPDYLAISYGGYRTNTRNNQPSVAELKEDMRILEAAGIKVLRTYNLQLAHASNVLKAIDELKKEDSSFEMYVMLGAWIDCKDAWTNHPNHDLEDEVNNTSEIEKAVLLANQYPEIVKIIAVGNEAMVTWATSYFVKPSVILKWVSHLQGLKKEGKLSKDVWVTTSDNFASWGGGDTSYHNQDLEALYKAVDYVSMHTYPMHDTHYNPVFWGVLPDEENLSKEDKIKASMDRAKAYAISQYDSVKKYMSSLGINKPIHIGETGWASYSNGFYGQGEANATDEYKEALFYKAMRDWTAKEGMSCFYFEAFDENWKDVQNPGGSENNFGLFTIDGKAKYALWDLVDKGVFENLKRNGNPITKTYNGDETLLLEEVTVPYTKVLQEH